MSKFIAAYATLVALRKNVDEDDHDISEDYVNQFHDSLTDIQNELGAETFSAGRFKIDPELITPNVASFNYVSGDTEYTKKRYCETRIFLTKLDAAITYLELIAPKEEKRRMGFSQE